MKPEIAQRLRELGAESAEELRLAEKRARQEEALDYYRKHGKRPWHKTALGHSWNAWTSSGPCHDPDFVSRAREAGWLPQEERRAVRQEEAIGYYRQRGVLPGWSVQWVIPRCRNYDQDFVSRARKAGWRPRKEATSALKEEALAYYKKHGKRPVDRRFQRWTFWIGNDPSFVAKLRGAGWVSYIDRSKALKATAIAVYRTTGKPPKDRTRLGLSWHRWLNPKGRHYDASFEAEARALGWRPRSERSK